MYFCLQGRRLGFELPEELVRGSEPTPACLSVIAVNYAAVRPGDLQQFLQNFRRTLVAEVIATRAMIELATSSC